MHLISKLLAAITLTSCHMSHEPSLYDWLKYSHLQVGSSEGMPTCLHRGKDKKEEEEKTIMWKAQIITIKATSHKYR